MSLKSRLAKLEKSILPDTGKMELILLSLLYASGRTIDPQSVKEAAQEMIARGLTANLSGLKSLLREEEEDEPN